MTIGRAQKIDDVILRLADLEMHEEANLVAELWQDYYECYLFFTKKDKEWQK